MEKAGIRLKGRFRLLLPAFIFLGAVLVLVDIFLYLFRFVPAGAIISVYIILYFAVLIGLCAYLRPFLLNELVSFATEYGKLQKTLLKELNLPYAVLNDSGRLVWSNLAFARITHLEKDERKSITSLFPSVTVDKFPANEENDTQIELSFEDRRYTLRMRRVSLNQAIAESDMIAAEEHDGYLIIVQMFDETALKLALQEVDNQSLAVALIYMDNYDEALESVEEVRRSLLTALVDRKVNKYIAGFDGIARKIEKDKYFVIMPKKSCEMMRESHFEILEDVKTVNIGNEMAVTLSIGIGLDGLSYAQNYEYARNAIDLALGRGGDQAVVKRNEETVYYGGKSQQVEKNTRVKARVKAHALKELINGNEKVIVMGHRLGDVDSFGASVGIYRIAKSLNRRCHIVLNDVTISMQPLVDLFRSNPSYEADMIIGNQQALDLVDDATVLVIVDVNKPSITECPELLHHSRHIVVLDHHRAGKEVVENATLSYVEPYASSTCEMVSEILQYIGEGVKIHAEEADSMYSGIMVDTNNFMSKTGVRTFEAAAYLRRNGADVTRVRKLFRENVNEYKAKADAVSQAEIYRGVYAISICAGEEVESPTVICAQAANELLNIKGIKASFVCTRYQNRIYVSARSIDEVNVQIIMERLGGGGHLSTAGCQMEDVSVTEAIGIIKNTLDTMIENGDLS